MLLVRAETLPDRPEDIDLRFLRKIRLSDTYNGVDSCADGVEYSAVLYGNKIVYEYAIYRDPNNMKHDQRLPGNELYRRMFEVSRAYLDIVEIARAKFFQEKIQEDADEHWDCVALGENIRTTFATHPQYQQMVEHFGLELEKVNDFFSYRVKCTKTYKAAA